MFSLLAVIGAGICKAIADTSDGHYDKSILKVLPRSFWDGTISWKNKWIFAKLPAFLQNILQLFSDSWHIFDLLRNLFMLSAIFTYKLSFNICIDFTIHYLVFSFSFLYFYHKYLYRE